jgi:hypothetical protein
MVGYTAFRLAAWAEVMLRHVSLLFSHCHAHTRTHAHTHTQQRPGGGVESTHAAGGGSEPATGCSATAARGWEKAGPGGGTGGWLGQGGHRRRGRCRGTAHVPPSTGWSRGRTGTRTRPSRAHRWGASGLTTAGERGRRRRRGRERIARTHGSTTKNTEQSMDGSTTNCSCGGGGEPSLSPTPALNTKTHAHPAPPPPLNLHPHTLEAKPRGAGHGVFGGGGRGGAGHGLPHHSCCSTALGRPRGR